MTTALPPRCYCSEQGGKKVRNPICSVSCCSLPSARPAYLGAAATCAGGRKICLPSLYVVCFIGTADWQMLMVCMCAHTKHIFHQAKASANATICVSVGVPVCVCVMIYWWESLHCCWICNCATAAATDLHKNMLFGVSNREKGEQWQHMEKNVEAVSLWFERCCNYLQTLAIVYSET